MVRVRLGSTWKQDPALRSALALGGAAAEQAAARAVDALAIEVEGVDVGAGRAEGTLLGSIEALGEGLLRILAGSARAQVHFSEGGVELVMARRGASALLTVVALGRPARVLARDVEVDLADLTIATSEAASRLADDLGASHPSAGAASSTGALRGLARRLEAARQAPAEAPPSPRRAAVQRPRRRPDSPTCAFELRDDEELLASYRGPGADLGSLLPHGRVALRASDGREIAAVDGPPFLVLRDLSAFAGRLADAVQRGEPTASVELAAPGRHATIHLEVDVRTGTLACEDRSPLPCPPLPLARALLEAAVDFCGVVAARNAWQADNGWLAELRMSAGERLAHVQELLAGDLVAAEGAPLRRRRTQRLPGAPLGPGRMRRLAFRRAWEADAGAPVGFGLAASGEIVVAAGRTAVLGLDARRGGERWRRPGVDLAALGGGALLLAGGARLASVEPVTGRERWSRRLEELPEGVRDVVRLTGGLALVLAPGSAAALDPASGKTVWTFEPPAALTLRAAALGPLAVLGSDAGLLYGVEAVTGRTSWRLRLPGPLTAPPLACGDACLVLCATELGGSLLAVDPGTGRRRFELPLDVGPSGAPVPFAGLLAVSGVVAGDPVVVAVDPEGRLAWEDAPPLGSGALALVPLPAGLLAKTPQGACVALDRDGATLWSHAREASHPPPANALPVVARRVALVPGEQLEALDVASGKVLGQADLTAPVRLIADARLNACGIDAEGVVTSVRLETHLSVV